MPSSNLEPLEFLNVCRSDGHSNPLGKRETEKKKDIRFILGDLILEREVFFMRVTSDGRRDFTDWNIRSDRVP